MRPSPDSPEAVYTELARRARVRARQPSWQRQVERSRQIIADAIRRGLAIVFYSGGKDSTALLHLARTVDPGIGAVFVDDGNQTPWTLEAIAAMRARGYDIQTIETMYTIPQMLRMVGWGGYDGPERLEGEWHWSMPQWREVLVEEPSERVRDAGYTVHLLGLRAEESRGRLMNRRAHGVIYERDNGTIVATPLADWSGEDVLAYCALHELPLSRVYLRPDDPGRARRRSAAALLTHAVWAGSWHELRADQPGFWQELAMEFPEIRRES